MTPLSEAELLSLHAVSVRYGGEPVLRDVAMTVTVGQFTGIVGPSGSGKTTLLKVLLGALEPTGGSVRRRAGLRVGYVPQVETVDWSFPVTVDECVRMARVHGWGLPWASRAERRDVAAILERLELSGYGDRHIRDLSGGQQQRVFVARALLGRPDLLLMDEPTSGVDVRTRHEMLHLLDDLHRDGLSVMLTTHDLNGMAAHLPHLICLNKVLIGQGSPREVLTVDVLERTYGARMEILEHAGMPIILDTYTHDEISPRLRTVGA